MNNRSNLLGGEFAVVQYWTGVWETEGEEVGRRCGGGDTGDGLSVVAASGWWLDQWLVVAGCRAWHVAPAPAGCCLKPPNKILRFSCHAAAQTREGRPRVPQDISSQYPGLLAGEDPVEM